MQVLILGAGAVGGYIGARLMSAGADVVFLARGQRLKDVASKGLVVRSPLGDFAGTAKVAGVAAPGLAPDVAIIACKAPALDDALNAIAPCIGSETRLLPLLNGLAHLETVQRRFPRAVLIGGLAHGALTLRDDGTIEHMTPFFSIIAGPVTAPSDLVADDIVGLLGKVGVDARLSRNIRQDMWNKFVFLTTLAGSTCLMRAGIGTIVATDHGEEMITRLLDECSAVARAEGFAPDDASMASYRTALTERGSSFTSSMLRDVLGGRRTEADHILGDMLKRAHRHGIDAPVMKIAYAHLQCHEATAA